MKTSDRGRRLIQEFESCECKAYPDPGSPLGRACAARGVRLRDYERLQGWQALSGAPWTIGWGHTGPEVRPGLVWTQEQADAAFETDLLPRERDVERLVTVPLTQGQFDALVSFVYNAGADIDKDTIAEGLGDSTLLKKLNAGDVAGAAEEFLKWTRSGGKVLGGLVRRRQAERALFLGSSIALDTPDTARSIRG